MKIAFAAAAVAAMAFAPLSVVATTPGVAQAAPYAGAEANPRSCRHCLLLERHHTSNVCVQAAPPGPAQAPPSRVPAQIPEVPPEPAPQSVTPVQTPQFIPPTPLPPSTVPVQIPKAGPGTATDAPQVSPPKGLDAPPQAVAAAKAAPETRVNPATSPKPPTQLDFNQQVQ